MRASALDPARDASFAYGALYRLNEAQGPFGQYLWTHDAAGNRLTESLDAAGLTTARTLAYGATSNRLNSVTSGGVTRAFGYSASGNTTSDDRGAGADLTLAYNAADRLVGMTEPGQTLGASTYDGLGRRVVHTAGGVTRHYHYDLADHLIAISNASGTDWVFVEMNRPMHEVPNCRFAPRQTADLRLSTFHDFAQRLERTGPANRGVKLRFRRVLRAPLWSSNRVCLSFNHGVAPQPSNGAT